MKKIFVLLLLIVIFCGCGKEKKTIECYDGKTQVYGSIVMAVDEEKYFSSVFFANENDEIVLSKSEVEFTYIGENLDKVKIEATRLNSNSED